MVSGFDFLLNQSIEYGNMLWLMAYGLWKYLSNWLFHYFCHFICMSIHFPFIFHPDITHLCQDVPSIFHVNFESIDMCRGMR